MGRIQGGKVIEDSIARGQLIPTEGADYYVDPASGVAGADAESWGSPELTVQAAIDKCTTKVGHIITLSRGGYTVTEEIAANKRGIILMASRYGGFRRSMDEHWIIADAAYTDGPVLLATEGLSLIGLTFASRWTTGPSVRATGDVLTGASGFYVEALECLFHGWGIGYDGFEFHGGSLGAVLGCTFDALANSGAGVSFRGSGGNNPVRNLIRDCLFSNLTIGIATRSATPQDNWIDDNRFQDCATPIHTLNGAGNHQITENHFEVDDDNAYDINHAGMISAGMTMSGNHYIEA